MERPSELTFSIGGGGGVEFVRANERTQTAADAVPSPVIERAVAAARGWIQSFSNHSKGVSGLTDDDDDAMSIEKRRNKDNKTVIRPRKRKTRGKENG